MSLTFEAFAFSDNCLKAVANSNQLVNKFSASSENFPYMR